MKRVEKDLLLICALTIFLILVITAFPVKPLRIALGLPFILFFPGYTLISALFVRKEDLEPLERIALSFGLSIAVVPLIGLILNYTPWGIRLYPILLSLSAFILIMSGVAWVRRGKYPEAQRFTVDFKIPLFKAKEEWRASKPLDKALTIILILSILGACGTLGYVIAKPKVGERFTEFYILGPGGKAEGYPKKLKIGEEGIVILGIVNHEKRQEKYKVEIRIDGEKIKEIGPIVLEDEEKWEEMVSFSPKKRGKNQKVEFILLKDEEPYLDLHIWIDVE